MSNQVLCSLYDRKSGTYSPVCSYADTATAERAFVGLLASGDSTPALWPDDFALYTFGSFDPTSGRFDLSVVPTCLLTGQQALAMLSDLRRRQAKGGAVGETGKPVSPEVGGPVDADHGIGVSDMPSPVSTTEVRIDHPPIL